MPKTQPMPGSDEFWALSHRERFQKVLDTGAATKINFGGNVSSTDTVIRKEVAPTKEAGWCEANGSDHAWEVQDYVLTTDPPQSVRICTNCGKRQYLQHAHPDWHD